jgi:hypothetical protein
MNNSTEAHWTIATAVCRSSSFCDSTTVTLPRGLLRISSAMTDGTAGGITFFSDIEELVVLSRAQLAAYPGSAWPRYYLGAALGCRGLARVYALLKPRLVEAYKELGHPDGDIDAAVEKAIVVLLQAPVTDGTEPLVQKVLSYRYGNETLEALLPAQKQLLRMGPKNVVSVQNQLRAVARELGIPFDRLPARVGQ